MSASLILFLLGLTAAVSWGVSDFFAAKSTKTVAPLLGVALVNTISALIFAVIFVVFLRHHVPLTAAGFWLATLGGIILSLGAACFFLALKAGPVSIVSPLTSTYPLITTVLALSVFHARLTSREIIGILLTVVGILLASGLISTTKGSRKITKGPALALLTAILWGLGYAVISQAIKRIDWQLTSLMSGTFAALTVILLLPLTGRKAELSWSQVRLGLSDKNILYAGSIQLCGAIALDIGISRSTDVSGAVVTALSATYPLLTIFLALKYLAEKTKFIPLTGAVVGIIGVIVLSLG